MTLLLCKDQTSVDQAAGVEELITIAADARDTIRLTILGEQEEAKTAADVANITYDNFARLYTVTTHVMLQLVQTCSQS